MLLAIAAFVAAALGTGAVARYRAHQHRRADGHQHEHGVDCGHEAIPHKDHVDYVHDGHLHAAHEGHYDEHGAEAVRSTDPVPPPRQEAQR